MRYKRDCKVVFSDNNQDRIKNVGYYNSSMYNWFTRVDTYDNVFIGSFSKKPATIDYPTVRRMFQKMLDLGINLQNEIQIRNSIN